MSAPVEPVAAVAATDASTVVASLLDAADRLPMDRLAELEELACVATGARRVRIYVADYAQHTLTPMRRDGESVPIDGTMLGRVFQTGEIHAGGDVVMAPMVEGLERFGVGEFAFDGLPPNAMALVGAVTRALLLIVVSKRRYTDLTLRARRQRPLTASAEMQWDLFDSGNPRAGVLHRR
jgi:hypothetical protein